MTDTIAEIWADVGVKVVVEGIDSATRHLKNRQQSYKRLWWSIRPRSFVILTA
jgi:hypothetical protein